MNDLNCWKYKFKLCHYSSRLLKKLYYLNKTLTPQVDLLEIKKAIYYAKKYHGEQKRLTGEPYYSHPLEVAYMVADYIFETGALVSSVLHDILEDTTFTKDMISNIFGATVAHQVESLTRIKQDHKISAAETIILLWQNNNRTALTIKQLDRLHNMQTIRIKPAHKQQKMILETLETFLPTVAYLGLLELEKKLSTICINANLNRQGLDCKKRQVFSFQDSYQPLSLVFQNEEC